MIVDMERERYRASTHYVWRLEPADILGEGAFGTVYRGFHKETCETVAIKTFNKMALKRPYSVQMRELNILEKLDHPNVVRLIAVEDEITSVLKHGLPRLSNAGQQGSGNSLEGKVLIMEMCTEGNLYSIVEQPENQFGLDETELLRVLSHTTSGMKYLRKNKIVHRDWKPSNILKTVTNDGDIFYKLCDFGAARELDDNEPFLSIVGTEEYIQPEIYGRGLLGKSTDSFSATSELWSFGVTLYHVTTGHLPFKPFGGRKNRDTMYKIISSKQSGVISGVQETENGPIVWSTVLPRYCRLSGQCKLFLTHLLSNVLETDKQKIWSFDRFFDEVDNFLSKLRIYCVSPDCSAEVVYVNKTARFEEIFETISQQFNRTRDENSNTLLFLDSKFFDRSSAVKCKVDIEALAATSSKRPLLVINDIPFESHRSNISFEFPLEPIFPDSPNDLSADYDYANRCSSLVFWALQSAKDRVKYRDICVNAKQAMIEFAEKSLSALERRCAILQRYWNLINACLTSLKGVLEDSSTLESAEKNCCQTKNALESEKINNQRMIVEWRGMNREDIVISHNNNILTVLDRSVCSTFEILMQFRNDKVLLVRHPSESQNNELKWHGLLKRQLRNTWNHVKEQFKNDIVLKDMLQLHQFLSSAQKFHSKLVLSKESLDLAEKMVITLDNSVKQLLLKHGCAQKPREVNGHSPVSTSEQDARNSSVSSSVSDSLLETIDDLKDMRKIALKNRSLLNEILSMSSDQTDVDSVEAS